MSSTTATTTTTTTNDWIVLGDRDTGMSYGPMPESEARQFAARVPGRLAISVENARSDLYTRLAYAL